MRKLLLTLPFFFVTTLALNASDFIDDVSAKHHSHSHDKSHRRAAESLTTSFTLTPVSNTGFTLSVVPASSNGLSIASDGTITFPTGQHWLVNYNINFASDPATQTAELNDIWNGIGAFQFSNGAFLGSILNFDGTTILQSTSPVSTQVIFNNLGAIPTLAPLSGTVTIHRLDTILGGR